jgi:hypothetical protein
MRVAAVLGEWLTILKVELILLMTSANDPISKRGHILKYWV